jgi:hypothetical protein
MTCRPFLHLEMYRRAFALSDLVLFLEARLTVRLNSFLLPWVYKIIQIVDREYASAVGQGGRVPEDPVFSCDGRIND